MNVLSNPRSFAAVTCCVTSSIDAYEVNTVVHPYCAVSPVMAAILTLGYQRVPLLYLLALALHITSHPGTPHAKYSLQASE